MNHVPSSPSIARTPDRRCLDRRAAALPGLLTWRDARGTTRFTSIVAREISDYGAFVECDSPTVIPLFRLVTLQLDQDAAGHPGIPDELRRAGKVLGAVYRRVMPKTENGLRQGYELRLLIEPRPQLAEASAPVITFGRRVRSIA